MSEATTDSRAQASTDQQARAEALERLKRLWERAIDRNRDLTEDEAIGLAD